MSLKAARVQRWVTAGSEEVLAEPRAPLVLQNQKGE